MKLLNAIDITAGGEGSGCHGDNCGRPRLTDLFDKQAEHESAKNDVRVYRSDAKLWENRYYKDRNAYHKERMDRANTNLDEATQKAEKLSSEVKDLSKSVVHENHGKFVEDDAAKLGDWGAHKSNVYKAPNGDEVRISGFGGWHKQGVGPSTTVRYKTSGGKEYQKSFDGSTHRKQAEKFLLKLFGIKYGG